MVKKIYLIRHGETDLNKKRAFYGSLDVPINETGIKQATHLREKMTEKKVDAVFTSGLKRAQMTGDIVFPDKSKKSEVGFNEKGFGLWEGLIADEIEAAFPKEWQAWLDAPFDYIPPEAEAFLTFKKRVIEAFKNVLENYKQADNITIVSHLGVIRVLITYLDPKQDFWSVEIAQDGYLEWVLEE